MTVGADAGNAHREAVDAVRRGLAELPPDAPVRLRKTTSNLFRFRDGGGGLAVDGLDRRARRSTPSPAPPTWPG